MRLCPIIFYSWKKVCEEALYHWCWQSWTPLPPPQFSWFTPNTKGTRWNHWLTPLPHFLEGELILWVDKAKNVRIIVGRLPIKAGWWDASFTLQGFSQNVANTPNSKLVKLSLLSPSSSVLTKKFTASELPSLYMFFTTGKWTPIFAVELCHANHWATDMEYVWISCNNIYLILNSRSVTLFPFHFNTLFVPRFHTHSLE